MKNNKKRGMLAIQDKKENEIMMKKNMGSNKSEEVFFTKNYAKNLRFGENC